MNRAEKGAARSNFRRARAGALASRCPGFLATSTADLRDRHLLPLVGVLLVAIVAVPIAAQQVRRLRRRRTGRKRSTPSRREPAPRRRACAERSSSPRAARGLRDYHRRLERPAGRRPVHPAVHRRAERKERARIERQARPRPPPLRRPPASDQKAKSPSRAKQAETVTTHHELKYYTCDDRRADRRRSPQQRRSERAPNSTVRRNLPELTMLPSREMPAMVFMGGADGKKALMLSPPTCSRSSATASACSAPQTCQLLALEDRACRRPSSTAAGERTYRIELLKIDLDETDKLRKAPRSAQPERERAAEHDGGAPARSRSHAPT